MPHGHPDTFGDGQDEQGKIVYEISGSFDDLAEDIASAYSVLWDGYGQTEETMFKNAETDMLLEL